MTAEPLLLTVPEAARLLRIGKNLAYELVTQGILPHIRLGRCIRVPRHALEEWVAHQAAPRPGDNAPLTMYPLGRPADPNPH